MRCYHDDVTHVALGVDSPPSLHALMRSEHGPKGREGLRSASYVMAEYSLHYYHYAATIVVDEKRYDVRPRMVSLTAPGARIHMEYPDYALHLSARFFAPGTPACRNFPVLQEPTHAAQIENALEEAIDLAGTSPRRARAKLWDVLLQLELPTELAGALHPAVLAAFEYIDQHWQESPSVPAIARKVGLSQSQLTRLFRGATGGTVSEYLQRIRAARALAMLEDMNLSIKHIAAECGFGSPQQFNKALRRILGASPTQLREGLALTGAPTARAARPRQHEAKLAR
jgi:AraC-like DNA-binding protein